MTALALGAALVLTGGVMTVCAVLATVYEISHRERAVLREDERHD